jgi:hypothetical protein
VIGLVILPMKSNRTAAQKYLEEFKELMNWYAKPSNLESLFKYYVMGDGWLTDKHEDAVRLLGKHSFFCRFNPSQLVIF